MLTYTCKLVVTNLNKSYETPLTYCWWELTPTCQREYKIFMEVSFYG